MSARSEKKVAQPKVQPLLCGACGGQVPLAEGNSEPCPFCGAMVPIPETYRVIRDANRISDGDRAKVHAAYKRLGTPPGLLLRAWAGGARLLWKGWWLCSVLSVFALLAALTWSHTLALPWGFDPYDVLGAYPFAGLCALAVVLVSVMPLIVVSYRESTLGLRMELGAGMAAKPPAQRGGPVQCRVCGAPLSVPPGALGVRCGYCSTDNLVALSPRWVTKFGSASRTEHRVITGALDAEESEIKMRRTIAWLETIGAVLLLGLITWIFGALLTSTADDHHSPKDWRQAVAASPRWFMPYDGDRPSSQRTPSNSHATFTLRDRDCGSQPFSCHAGCALHFAVPLHKGETFRVAGNDLPHDTSVCVISPEASFLHFRGTFRDAEPARAATAEFVAPYSGWFRVVLELPHAMPPAKVDALITIE